MSVFEIAMLACFGLSWPLSIRRAWRTRFVLGKSPFFIAVVALGYLFGILHKLLYSPDPVMVLYAANLVMVCTDLFLYFRYRHNPAPMPRE